MGCSISTPLLCAEVRLWSRDEKKGCCALLSTLTWNPQGNEMHRPGNQETLPGLVISMQSFHPVIQMPPRLICSFMLCLKVRLHPEVTYLGTKPVAGIGMIMLICKGTCTGSAWPWTTSNSAPPLLLTPHSKSRHNSALLMCQQKSFRHLIPSNLKWWREFAWLETDW